MFAYLVQSVHIHIQRHMKIIQLCIYSSHSYLARLLHTQCMYTLNVAVKYSGWQVKPVQLSTVYVIDILLPQFELYSYAFICHVLIVLLHRQLAQGQLLYYTYYGDIDAVGFMDSTIKGLAMNNASFYISIICLYELLFHKIVVYFNIQYYIHNYVITLKKDSMLNT